MTEGDLCHFLQFAPRFFASLRGKTGLYSQRLFCIINKNDEEEGYHAESGEKRGGGVFPFRF